MSGTRVAKSVLISTPVSVSSVFAVNVKATQASNMDSSDFEFKKWTEEYELEEETVKLLMDLGFKSYKSLSKLTEESCKKLFSRMITPGQYVLLEAGLEMLRPTTGQASSLAPQDPTPTRTAPTEVSVTAQQGPA